MSLACCVGSSPHTGTRDWKLPNAKGKEENTSPDKSIEALCLSARLASRKADSCRLLAVSGVSWLAGWLDRYLSSKQANVRFYRPPPLRTRRIIQCRMNAARHHLPDPRALLQLLRRRRHRPLNHSQGHPRAFKEKMALHLSRNGLWEGRMIASERWLGLQEDSRQA